MFTRKGESNALDDPDVRNAVTRVEEFQKIGSPSVIVAVLLALLMQVAPETDEFASISRHPLTADVAPCIPRYIVPDHFGITLLQMNKHAFSLVGYPIVINLLDEAFSIFSFIKSPCSAHLLWQCGTWDFFSFN